MKNPIEYSKNPPLNFIKFACYFIWSRKMKRFILLFLFTSLFVGFAGCRKNNTPVDTNKPFIIIKGANPIYSQLDAVYHDPGAEAYDVTANGDTISISNLLKVTNNINIHKRGTYKVRYNVSDNAGNEADEKIRNVIVEVFK